MATTQYLKSTAPNFGFLDCALRLGSQAREVSIGDSANLRAILNLRACNTTIGTGAGTSTSASTATGPTAGKLVGVRWISSPLAADVTISGSIQFNICGSESSMNANAGWQVIVYRVDATGALTQIVNSEFGTEMGTSQAKNTWTATPTSTDMKIGDRLLICVLANDAGGTMGNGFTATCNYGGANANTADSSVVFNESITFLTSAPSGSSYYLRDTAHASITNGKMLSTTIGASAATAIHTTIAGPCTYPGDNWTASAGGSDVEWYTPQLTAFTLSGIAYIKVQGGQAWEAGTGNSPHDIIIAEVAVCDADGSNASVWAASYFQPQQLANGGFYLQGPDKSVAQGKILRLRFYQADGTSNASSGTNRTINYNDSAANNKDVFIQFTQTITEGSITDMGSGKVRVVERLKGATMTSLIVMQGKARVVERLKGASLTQSQALAGKVRHTQRLKGASLIQALELAAPTRNNFALHTEDLSKWVTGATVNSTTPLRQQIYTARVTAGTLDSIKAPNNTMTGEAMLETAVTGDHLREGNFSRLQLDVGEPVIYSDHFHSGLGRDWMALSVFDGRNGKWWLAWFDVTNGVVGHKDSGIDDSGMELTPYGWYRCWIKYTAAVGAGTDHIYLGSYIATSDGAESGTPGNGANRPQYLGDVTKGMYVWGAMWDLHTISLRRYLPNTETSPLRIQYAYGVSSRAAVRLKGATFENIVVLVGKLRSVVRLKGASLVQSLALQGKVRAVERLKGASLVQSQPLQGKIRVVERLKGASVTIAIALRGTARVVERLKGAQLTQSLALQGKVRAVERLKGSQLTQSQPLSGKVRIVERLKGASLTQSQPLRGTIRAVERLRGASISLIIALQGRIRVVERLKGATLLQSLALSGKIRTVERLKGAQLTQTLPLVGRIRVVERLKGGQLVQTLELTGKIRGVERLKGAQLTIGEVWNAGKIRIAPRLKGAQLQQALALQGKLRSITRLKGAALTQSLPLSGKIRVIERLLGGLLLTTERSSLSGWVSVWPMLDGTIIIAPMMRGETAIAPMMLASSIGVSSDGIVELDASLIADEAQLRGIVTLQPTLVGQVRVYPIL